MEMGDCMEEMKMISNVGYEIGKKAKLHDFEILRLFEFIKYDQYHEFFKQITSIARDVKISLPDQLFKYDFETFYEKLLSFNRRGLLKYYIRYKIT